MLDDPYSAGQYLVQLLKHERREVVGMISLDSRHRLIRQRHVVTGIRCSAPVDPAELLRQALYDHAASLLIYHNHPSSGEPSISKAVSLLTGRLAKACAAIQIPLLDHLVVSAGKCISIRTEMPSLFDPVV